MNQSHQAGRDQALEALRAQGQLHNFLPGEDRGWQSENLLRALTEQADTAVFIKDREGRYLLINPAGAALVGQTMAEVIGQDDRSLFGTEVGERIQAIDRMVMDTGESAQYEDTTDTGVNTRYWHTVKTPFRNEQGHIIGVVGISTDITARKRAERELDRFFSVAYSLFCICDYEGRFLRLNASWERVLGWSIEEMLSTPYIDLVHPDDRELTLQVVGASIRGDPLPAVVENRYRCKDGTYRWLSWQAVVAQGERLIYGTAQDVTEVRQGRELLAMSEQYFRALIENASDLIVILGPDGAFRYVSPSVKRILAREPGELVGRQVREVIHPDDWAETEHSLAYQQAHPWQGRTVVRRMRHADGTWRWLEGLSVNLSEHPAVGGIVGNFRDISDRKKAEQALVETEARLRQAEKMEAIGRMAGGVAHDFNNLLTVIIGYGELLVAALPAASAEGGFARESLKAANRASELTRQLLAFGRKAMVAPRPVDLHDLLRDAERLLRRVIGEDVSLAITAGPGPWRIKADPGQLHQVLMNLAANARDAMPTGGRLTFATAAVSLSEAEAGPLELTAGPYVLLEVRDTGRGVSEELRAHLFEPFYTTKGVGKGTGLGLASVFGIVKQSGGGVAVESAPGQGAVFRLYFPPTAEPLPPAGSALAALPRGTETLLLVEDEPSVREITCRTLRECGYTVYLASNGEEALAWARHFSGRLDLLVSDIVMPLMGGRELAERLVAERPGLRVLFLSGHTDDSILRHGVHVGEVALLAKPFTMAALARKVREVLDVPAAVQ